MSIINSMLSGFLNKVNFLIKPTSRVLLCFFFFCQAYGMDKITRKKILDDIRPSISHLAGQSIKFKINVLNENRGWVLLVGELRSASSDSIDWRKAKDCDENLDKMLWVVAKSVSGSWVIEDMAICAPEPPFWYLEPKMAFSRPCEIYAGLEDGTEKTIENQCKEYKKSNSR